MSHAVCRISKRPGRIYTSVENVTVMMDMNVGNSSTRWSDDILVFLVQYEIALNHFNYIEPLIMLCVPYDIAEYFHIHAYSHHTGTIIINQSF